MPSALFSENQMSGTNSLEKESLCEFGFTQTSKQLERKKNTF